MLLFFPKGHYHLLNQILIRCTEPSQCHTIDDFLDQKIKKLNKLLKFMTEDQKKSLKKYADKQHLLRMCTLFLAQDGLTVEDVESIRAHIGEKTAESIKVPNTNFYMPMLYKKTSHSPLPPLLMSHRGPFAREYIEVSAEDIFFYTHAWAKHNFRGSSGYG